MVDTLIARLVEPFELRHATRKAVRRARLYFFDIGVANRLLGRKTLAASTPEYGAAFETYLAHELHAWRDYTASDEPIRYFRTQDGLEVDFILGDHTAVEVKSTSLANEKHAKPLLQLHALHKVRRRLLVTRDRTRRKLGTVEVWPWRESLAALWDGAIV